MKPSEYLDKCKIALGIQSDYALAKALKVSTPRISDYYKGKAWPDAYACARIALALKLDPLEVVADIESQHAKSEERREFWKGFIGRTGKAGGFLLLALCCWIFFTAATETDPAIAQETIKTALAAVLLLSWWVRIIYIMSNRIWPKNFSAPQFLDAFGSNPYFVYQRSVGSRIYARMPKFCEPRFHR